MLCIASLDPILDLLLLVGGIVVEDHMQGQLLRRFPMDLLQKPQPLDMGMILLQAAEDLAFEIVQGGK